MKKKHPNLTFEKKLKVLLIHFLMKLVMYDFIATKRLISLTGIIWNEFFN